MGQYTQRHDSEGGPEAGGKYAAHDPQWAAAYPALVEFLTEQLDDSGKQRVVSTLMVCAEDGRWKLCLVDRAQLGGKFDYKVWVSGQSLAEALTSMDTALQEGTAEWRRFPRWEPPKKR